MAAAVALDRSFNNLSGTIPAGWLPRNLGEFWASKNLLSLPWDGPLPSLVSLRLDGNPLSGPLPASLLSLPSLKVVELHDCNRRLARCAAAALAQLAEPALQ